MILRCATSNPGKLREFRASAGHWGFPEVTIEAVPGLERIAVPDEHGLTFEENAAAKAVYYSRFCDDPVFADDSGLVVDALDGAPGVHSARFAGPGATDADNNRLLVERLAGAGNRAARFVCAIALAQGGEVLASFSGSVEGVIIDEPRGPNGFGYDPLFFHPPFGCTFGEVPAERKMDTSHRGKALLALLKWTRASLSSGRS